MITRSVALVIFMLWPVNILLGDGPLWQKELPSEPNTGCYPCGVVADVLENRLLIYGIRMQTLAGEGDLMLWEVNPDGSLRQELRIGYVSKELALPISTFGSIALEAEGNIAALGGLDSNTSVVSLLVVNREGGKESVKGMTKPLENHDNIVIRELLSCDNSILVGGKQGTNGFLIKLDDQGNEEWYALFDLGGTEVFTDIAVESNRVYVAGMTVNIDASNRMGFGSETQNFLLTYDRDGQLLEEDYFDGVCSTKPPQLGLLENGNVLLAYDKSADIRRTELNVRAYSPESKLIWETKVLGGDGNGPPGYFKILGISTGRFIIGNVANGSELVIVECSSDGQVIRRWSLGRVVGPYGKLHLVELGGKGYAVFGTLSHGRIYNVKINICAFPME